MQAEQIIQGVTITISYCQIYKFVTKTNLHILFIINLN